MPTDDERLAPIETEQAEHERPVAHTRERHHTEVKTRRRITERVPKQFGSPASGPSPQTLLGEVGAVREVAAEFLHAQTRAAARLRRAGAWMTAVFVVLGVVDVAVVSHPFRLGFGVIDFIAVLILVGLGSVLAGILRRRRAVIAERLLRGEPVVYGRRVRRVLHDSAGTGYYRTYRVALYDRERGVKIAGLRAHRRPELEHCWVLGWGEPRSGHTMLLADASGAFVGRPNLYSRFMS